MAPGRGKIAAWTAAAAAVAVLATSALALRAPALEWWMVRQAESADEDTRTRASEWLAEHGTARSIRLMLEKLGLEEDQENDSLLGVLDTCLERRGLAASPALAAFAGRPPTLVLVRAAEALLKLDRG